MRIHSSICTTQYDHIGSGAWNKDGILNATQGVIGVYCPVPSSSSLRHSSVSTINVHGYEFAGHNNTSRACVHHFNSTSIACGTTKSWGSGNSGVYNVDPSKWTAHGSSFAYIYTQLNKSGRLSGFWISE